MVEADCKRLTTDVGAAEKIPWPQDDNAESNWSQGLAMLLGASERCDVLIKTLGGGQFDSVLNTATAGREGMYGVTQELGFLGLTG